jgi:predicted Zn-dependent protease
MHSINWGAKSCACKTSFAADPKRSSLPEPSSTAHHSTSQKQLHGIAGVALDRREQARAALQKALSIDPTASVRAHVHLASLLIKERRPQEAAREIEAYLEAVPNPFDAEKLHALLAQLRAAPDP